MNASGVAPKLPGAPATMSWPSVGSRAGRARPIMGRPFKLFRDYNKRRYNKPAPDCEVIQPPTALEAAAIMEAAPDHLRRVIMLAYCRGCVRVPWSC